MDFAQFIAPLGSEEFEELYYGQRPLHLRAEGTAGSARAALLSSDRLALLLSVPAHWTADNLKLIFNSRPVLGDHYLSEVETVEGPQLRADSAKVQTFLGMGASLVANRLEDVAPEVRRITAMLGEHFAASAGANAYASFKGVQAFESHCDLHEVFAVQLEGEKKWRIYQNRAQAPVATLEGPDAQAQIDRAKGPVAMTVHMKPGDLLYIPRGYFHDALADSGSSLHLTFAVLPLDGRYLFRLLQDICIRDPEFRAYLPDGRARPALTERLGHLAERTAEIIRSPIFAEQIAAAQRRRAHRFAAVDFADRVPPDYVARTDRPGAVEWDPGGAVLRVQEEAIPLGMLAQAAEWALEQTAFSSQQLAARFAWLDPDEVQRLVDALTRTGLFVPYQPGL